MMLPGLVVGGELELLRTAQNIELPPFIATVQQAIQSIVHAGEQITNLLLSGTGLAAVAAVLLFIAIGHQYCLIEDTHTFLIPPEAIANPKSSGLQSSKTTASCPPVTAEPDCMK